METVWKSFAENGPWAMVAGFLLFQVMKAWSADRTQLNDLLTGFKDALLKLTDAVEDLRSEIRTVNGGKD